MELRLRLIFLAFLFATLALASRLFYWQVVHGATLAALARAQQTGGVNIEAHRGNVLDAGGGWLAASDDNYLLFASLPNLEESAGRISKLLAPLFVDEASESIKEDLLNETLRIENALSQQNVVWVPVKRRIDKELRQKIESLDIKGLGFEPEESRFYPEGSSSAHLLGFLGRDNDGNNKGYFGLEGFYDLTLAGRAGYQRTTRSAVGSQLIFGEKKRIDAIGGVDLITHIDKPVQLTVEEKLTKGIEKYGAKSGIVIVMDPKDGGIMAMASWPSYDPKEYWKYGDSLFRNPSISDSFEPGSIFKPVVMAAGFDAGVVEPDTHCDICTGAFKIDKYYIGTWDGKYYPNSTMIDVIKHSDNVGMVFVGQKLGIEKFNEYIRAFGFGSITGIDLEGESTPKIRKSGEWSKVDLATSSFGQGIAVTPIQMVRAIGAIANDGVLVTPQVVDKLRLDNWEEDLEAEIGDRVISTKAAKQMKEVMVLAVKEGEAQWTVPKGFKIAGKTGTAQIPIEGHYDQERTIASFIGFAPADDPKFVMLVTLMEPQSSPWASETAAPLWFDIALEMFPYLGIQPEN
jgi:cell division protein FtsI/penicillin-binding protein 2